LPPRRKSGRQFRDQNRWLAPPAECQRNTIYFVRSLGLDRAFPSPAFARKGISRLARSTCCQRPSALRTRRCASVRTTVIDDVSSKLGVSFILTDPRTLQCRVAISSF